MEFSHVKLVSNRDGGLELLNEVVSLTGLPEQWTSEVQAELTSIVKTSGHAPQNLTLDELRASMVAYLETLQKEFEDQEQLESEQRSRSNAALCGRTFCVE